MRAQFPLVVRLQRLLTGRQAGPQRVVHQVQREAAAGLAVTQGVQRLQGGNALVEYAIAALLVNVGRRIAGHGGHDVDPVLCQESGHTFVPRFAQDSEVAAVHHFHALGGAPWGCACRV